MTSHVIKWFQRYGIVREVPYVEPTLTKDTRDEVEKRLEEAKDRLHYLEMEADVIAHKREGA